MGGGTMQYDFTRDEVDLFASLLEKLDLFPESTWVQRTKWIDSVWRIPYENAPGRLFSS